MQAISDQTPAPVKAALTRKPYAGRFAPSPTGPLHAGSMAAALASRLDARAHAGHWHVRIEDIDPPREINGAARQILALLDACGLHGDRPPTWQHTSTPRYEQALGQLASQGQAYRCTCSRKAVQLERARLGLAPAPHGKETPYPGTCRHLGHEAQSLHGWRLNTAHARVRWHERQTGADIEESVEDYPGDFILRRRDGLWSYQLAVVCDDAAEGITDIVRGDDLADNTARQRLLQERLGAPLTRYLHIPVVCNSAGEKLSKQTSAPAIALPQTEAQTLAILQQALMNLGFNIRTETIGQFWPQAIESWARRFRIQTES